MPGLGYRAPSPVPYHGISEEESLRGLAMTMKADSPAHETAAIVLEPVLGEGGFYPAPPSFLKAIRKICDENDIMMIVDEVQSGFGRTGNWFGSQTVGIKPHIMSIAKGLSSGYAPIGGSIVCDEVAEVVGATEFNHGYTYSGHPVSCAVALENLRILEEEKIVEHVRDDVAPYLKEKWEALADHPLVGEAKIVGMMGSIALTPNKETRAPFEAEAGTVGYKCREHCFGNNLVMRHVGDRMIISPPLVMTRDEVDVLIERATRALDLTYEQIKAEGLYK